MATIGGRAHYDVVLGATACGTKVAEATVVPHDIDPPGRVDVRRHEGGLDDDSQLAQRRLIAADVVSEYTFVDELLSSLLAHHYFPRRTFTALWRTKKFRRFNYFVLEKLSLIEKLEQVRDIRALPKDVVDFIHRLNGLRNALAHAFFPENLRGERARWRGKEIFSIEGFRAFQADADEARTYLVKRAFNMRVS